MSYIAAEDILEAKKMDLLTFLRNYEPQELVHVSGNTYCTREHDSLRISNGKWCWFSQGIGGRSALDYLIKVKGYSFIQAVETILGRAAEKPPIFYCPRERKTTELLMPKLSKTTDIEASLESYQKTVGGYIEAYYPFEEPVCIVCNEEGKINGLPLNRAVYADPNRGEMLDIIAGTFFVCDCSGENFGSLSPEQLRRYTELFKHPERFFRADNDIKAVPYIPERSQER